jgi:GT2 family glycosyltransferase
MNKEKKNSRKMKHDFEDKFSSLYLHIKKRYLSHDSAISVSINSFIDLFKKNKKNKINRSLKHKLIDYNKVLTLPVYAEPLVSIIIPAYNGWKMNFKCIFTIIEDTHGVAYEVILADDCSTDKTKNIQNSIQNIVHVRTEKNIGFLLNCNNAAEKAKGKYILFLNNDTEVTPGWLSSLVKLIERDESIGMVGSKLIYPDGSLQEAGGILWKDGSAWNYGNAQDPNASEYNYVKEVDYISGASILIRKDLWKKTNGFDTRYTPAYCEDSDIAFQIRKMGYKVLYQPLSEVIHYEGFSHGTDASLKKNNNKSIKAYQQINNVKFQEKWEDILLKEHLPNAQNVFKARDRSINKKTILVIDHYVPQFDKDAGSRTTFSYLELFVSLGLNVKFLGDNFYNDKQYASTLQQLGIEVLYGSWYMKNWKNWIKDNAANFDFILINRPHITIKYIDFIKENTTAKILYYGHDLHFLREEQQYKIEKKEKLLKSIEKWKAIETSIFEKSDIILTPSFDEKKIITALDASFKVETILPFFFKKTAVAIPDFAERKDILFIGGFNHSPNVDAIDWFCKQVWPLVQSKFPSAKFIIAGSNPPESITNLQSSSIQVKGFVSDEELNELYQSVKIVVIPLRYGAGVKGKTVEAMYHGVPIVSTSFGIEGMPGDYNFLQAFNEQDSFASEIITLYNNEQALQKASLLEANYINAHFTQQAAANQMKHLLQLQ